MLNLLAQGLHPPALAYIILNIDPVLLRVGAIAVRWYGVAYVVAIAVGLTVISRWARRMGVSDDQLWGLFIWTAIAGLVGGRLYFVIQQPDLVNDYLLKPINIIAVWNGGMAFFGAIFLGGATLFILAPRYGLDRWLALDGGALFGAVGQIFGRFGNVVNGDILGYQAGAPVTPPQGICLNAPCVSYVSDPHTLAWALVYLNPHSFAPQGIPFQPAQFYEMGLNIIALALLWPLRLALPRLKTGVFFALYLAMYAISQFVVFFFRGTEPYTPFLGINGLKQAQWTAIFAFILALALLWLARRFGIRWPFTVAKPVPYPLPAGGLDAALTVAWKAQSATRAAQAASAAPGYRAVPAVRQTGPSWTGRLGSALSSPATDTTPWNPGDSRFGSLRNRFGLGGRGKAPSDAPTSEQAPAQHTADTPKRGGKA